MQKFTTPKFSILLEEGSKDRAFAAFKLKLADGRPWGWRGEAVDWPPAEDVKGRTEATRLAYENALTAMFENPPPEV